VDTNFSVGSIFSIWKAAPNHLIGDDLRSQVNGILAIYGPRTTVLFYNEKLDKVQELTLIKDTWVTSYEHLMMK
jgi:fructose-1,6-bisphosphatase